MFKIPTLNNITKSIWETYLRFPFALAFAFIATAIGISLTYIDNDNTELIDVLIKAEYTSLLGFLFMLALHLYNEKVKPSLTKKVIIIIIGFIHLLVYYFSITDPDNNVNIYRFFLFAFGLHLTISFIPFLSKGEINAFWQFNKFLFLRLLTAVFYSLILYIGLSLAILAIDKLFNADISGDIYLRLWIFIAGIFNTLFFLVDVPRNVSELEENKSYPKGLKIFTQFVLLPLIGIYLAILYVYMFKIIFTWNIPKGWVSYLVLFFSTIGIFALLLIYPIRNDEGNKWIKAFSRGFYIALFPLIILLIIAIWQRIAQYGITENRYFVIVLALLLTCLSIYFLFSKTKNIKYIPITLCVVALLSSSGPWSAFSISRKSQQNRLKTILTNAGVLINNKISFNSVTIPEKDYSQMHSIVHYLGKNHGFDGIKDWFVEDLDSIFIEDSLINDRAKSNRIIEIFETAGIESKPSEKYFEITAETRNHFNISDYDYFIRTRKYSLDKNSDYKDNAQTYNFDTILFNIGYSASTTSVVISNENIIFIKINLAKVLLDINNKLGNIEDQDNVHPKYMNIIKKTKNIKVEFNVTRLGGYYKDKQNITINYFEADILIKLK